MQVGISTEENLRIAQGIFGHVQTLRSYVEDINSSIASHGVQVCLDVANADPAYVHIADNLLIAGSQKPIVPSSAVEGLRGHRVKPDDIIQRVIQTALRLSPDLWEQQKVNVLALGFSSSRPSGRGSRFRTLDARAPSSVIEILLSSPWQTLFSQLGHVVMYYLLSSTALLLPLRLPIKRTPLAQEAVHRKRFTLFNSSLLQLCGEMPKPAEIGENKNLNNESTIDFRKHVLHRTARDKYLPLVNRAAVAEHTLTQMEDEPTLSRTTLQRQSLLNDGLPSMHFLQRLTSNRRSALSLFRLIFGADSHESRCAKMNVSSLHVSEKPIAKEYKHRKRSEVCPLPKRMKPILPILQTFIRETKSKSFRDILGQSCPLPAWLYSSRSTSIDVTQITKAVTKPRLVARFLVACVRQSFPPQLLGSVKNRQILDRAIHEFIRKRTRNESFDPASFFANNGFKITDVPWVFCNGSDGIRVRNPTDLNFRLKKFSMFLAWTFHGYLVPILLKSFYVTESTVFSQRILYYRKEIWVKLQDNSMKEALHRDRRLFEPISTDALISGIHRRDQGLLKLKVGISPCQFITCFQLRFVPKTSGTRPIQRLQAKPWGKLTQRLPATCASNGPPPDPLSLKKQLEKARRGTKSFLSTAQRIFRVCCKQKPGLLGSSVFGLDDIYAKVVQFKQNWLLSGRKRIFAVALDIAKSFDTIPLNTLSETVIPQVLAPVRYVVIRYAIVIRNEVTGRILRRFESHICHAPGEEASFTALITNKLHQRHPRAIFIDLVRVQIIHREDLLKLLQDYLQNNIVMLPRWHRRSGGTPYARQIRGVGQGNPASPVLASLFYGHIEQRHLKEFLQESFSSPLQNCDEHLLLFMRQVDDTFFASNNKLITSNFICRMTQGWDEASGLNINAGKSRSNFDSNIGGQENLTIIPWCGLLVDTKSVEIRCDFSRYIPPRLSCLRESLSIDFGVSAGKGLLGKSWTCFRPKIHPILMDVNINSRRTVALNVYQASLLLALKICAHALAIDVQNSTFLLDIVQNAICRVAELVRRSAASTVGRRYSCKQPLSAREIQYLVVHAFAWAFCERLSLHKGGRRIGKPISTVLSTSLQNIEGEVTSCMPTAAKMLFSVTQCPSNQVLWKIRL